VARLREAAHEAGRDPSAVAVAPQLICAIARTHEAAVDKFRGSWMYQHLRSLTASTMRDQNLARLEEYNLVGAPDELVERIGLLRTAGVTMLAAMNFVGSTVGEWLDDMQYFAESVLPALDPARR
jgi:alkanesulfonate monooxygenase SsuD/methylene tetrahydromethanopterin reductase-like flavin-dependent oxidoreductase (luciferase family)